MRLGLLLDRVSVDHVKRIPLSSARLADEVTGGLASGRVTECNKFSTPISLLKHRLYFD